MRKRANASGNFIRLGGKSNTAFTQLFKIIPFIERGTLDEKRAQSRTGAWETARKQFYLVG